MKRTFRARPVQLAFAVAVMGLTAFACGDDPVDSGPKPDAGPGDGAAGDGGLANQPTKFSRANRGSVLDISEDDTILVAANRDVGTISVFDVAGPTLTKRVEVPVCAEPFQVSLTPNGERAFVVCREAQKVVRVDNLRTQPVKGPEVAVGSEPVGIALTPKATSAYVANWVDGTLMELDTETLAIKTTIDLNAPLVETGVLGTVAPRTALAHPRSVAITNNKDENENDESVFVTEYFSQTKEPLSADGRNADIARQGYVYRVSVKDKTVRAIPLPPFNDIGIQDHAGGVVGCHANQTQAVDVQGSFAYVLSICASPKGPLADYAPPFANCAADATCPGGAAGACDVGGGKCTTNCTQNADCGVNGGVCANNVCQTNSWDAKAFQTPAIHVIDIGANKVIAQVALNGEFDKLFAEAGLPDDSSRRFPLNIDDISFVPGTLIGYVAAKGSDAVYRVEFNATYETKAVDALGSPGKPFIPLDLGTIDAAKQGKLPTGLIVAHKAKLDAPERWAYVVNEATRNITSLDLTKDEIAGLPDAPAVVSSADMPSNPEDEAKLEGKRLFGTGLGRWSFKGQAWGSCESCHWEGLSDQETWFHLKGPRQSPSLDQTFDKKTGAIHQQNWGAVADEIEDHEGGALRGILGGVGAIVNNTALANSSRIGLGKYGGLNGSSHRAASTQATSSEIEGGPSVLDDWKFVGEYIKSIRIPHKPSNLDRNLSDVLRNGAPVGNLIPADNAGLGLAAACLAGIPSAAQAQRADGTYPVTLACDGAGGSGPVRAGGTATIGGGRGSYEIRLGAGRETGRIPTGQRPYVIALAAGKGFVTDQYSNTVTVFDPASLKRLAAIDVGDHPEGIAATRDGKTIVVANWGDNALSLIDPVSLAVTGTVETGDGPRAFGDFLR